MPTHATCEKCATDVDPVLCKEHIVKRCDRCRRTVDGLLCDTCADIEYGDDGDAREPDEDDLASFIEHAVITDDVGDLSAAIRRGDRDEAEYLLDKIASVVPGWSDRVEIGRYEPRARAA